MQKSDIDLILFLRCITSPSVVRQNFIPTADGTDETTVAAAMAAGIEAAVGPELLAVSAGNYGGKLGKFHFHLHRVLSLPAAG